MTFSPAEFRNCLKVLKAVDADRGCLTQLTAEERRELMTLAGLVAKPERHALVRMAKAFRRTERAAAQQQDRHAIEQSGLRIQRRSPTYSPLWLPPPDETPESAPLTLSSARACYICKQPYRDVHRYYDSLCRPCGDFNYARREATADLSGRYALVTGARVKIGFQTALKLLRAGASVVVSTRFPIDAAERYSQEPDYAGFRGRLQIHGLDLRHAPSVEVFARWLTKRLPRLDYLINNACQTVRRPAGFFQHLLQREATPFPDLPRDWQGLLEQHESLCQLVAGTTQSSLQQPPQSLRQYLPGQLTVKAADSPAEGLVHSAALSQRRYLDEDFQGGEALYPAGQYDEDRQQRDLRELNSWRLRLHEVETPELLEVHLVNAIAPYILNARLKPLMMRSGCRDLHVVNVSAMEGQFYRTTKTDRHPHTNMAKAALNMMTRTSAPDFVRDGIHMNAVDTGWVTDEDPAIHATRKAELGFAPPLDIIDGAARIVDPIFSGIESGTHVWGQFLKDYKPAPW